MENKDELNRITNALEEIAMSLQAIETNLDSFIEITECIVEGNNKRKGLSIFVDNNIM